MKPDILGKGQISSIFRSPKTARKVITKIRENNFKPEEDIVLQLREELSEKLHFVSAKKLGDVSDQLIECHSCVRPVRIKFSYYAFIESKDEDDKSDEQLYFCKRCAEMVGIKH